ncbi:hypothetical protein STENM223S_07578 [Streptomyces tendae]
MPHTYRCSMPRDSTRFRQCCPIRHTTSASSSVTPKPSTYGSAVPRARPPSSAACPASLAMSSGAT